MAMKRYSRQRELIYQALCSTVEHPTADMVYQWLKPENPSLSLGTVYRNLNLLADEGIIIRMPFPVERYDANIRPHPHFCCRRCGAVSDLELPYDTSLDAQVSTLGYQVERHSVLFSGICTHCLEQSDSVQEEPAAVAASAV